MKGMLVGILTRLHFLRKNHPVVLLSRSFFRITLSTSLGWRVLFFKEEKNFYYNKFSLSCYVDTYPRSFSTSCRDLGVLCFASRAEREKVEVWAIDSSSAPDFYPFPTDLFW